MGNTQTVNSSEGFALQDQHKINAVWQQKVNEILPLDTRKSLDSFVSQSEFDPSRKMIPLLREFLRLSSHKDRDFKSLTVFFEKNDVAWKELNNFRDSMVEKVKAQVRRVTDMPGDDEIKAFGTTERGSDVDITISTFKNPVFPVLVFGYLFGRITETKILDKGQDDSNPDDLFRYYVRIFSPVFDVVAYSSNGVIMVERLATNCTASQRYLNEVRPGMYHIVHKSSCCAQRNIYDVTLNVLFQRLRAIAFRTKIASVKGQNIHQEGSDAFYRASNKETCDMLRKIRKVHQLKSHFERFKYQIYYSQRAFEIQQQITQEDCAEPLFCNLAAKWEYYQLMANIVSPEAALAVPTFVATVMEDQRKMGDRLILTSDAYFLAYLENVYSIFHQLEAGSVRKGYKYALRAQHTLEQITGLKLDWGLSSAENKQMRTDKILEAKSSAKVYAAAKQMFKVIWDIAPIRIRLQVKGTKLPVK